MGFEVSIIGTYKNGKRNIRTLARDTNAPITGSDALVLQSALTKIVDEQKSGYAAICLATTIWNSQSNGINNPEPIRYARSLPITAPSITINTILSKELMCISNIHSKLTKRH